MQFLAAEIEFEMEKFGKKMSRVDSLIASTFYHDSILFTLNIKHYRDIEGLRQINLSN